jgi:hypothetical protein
LDVEQFRAHRAPTFIPVLTEVPAGADLRPCVASGEFWVIDRTQHEFVDGSLNAVDFGGDDEFIATTQMHQGAVAFLNWEDGLDESGLKPEFVGHYLRGRVIGLYREVA